MLFVCAAFCTEEEEQLKKEIEKEQKEKTQHEQNLRMLEAEKRQLADVLAVKEKAVEEKFTELFRFVGEVSARYPPSWCCLASCACRNLDRDVSFWHGDPDVMPCSMFLRA